MNGSIIQLRDLQRIWRVVIAVVAFELAGGLIAWAIGYHYSSFHNFATGAGLAALPGFMLGAVWHLRSPQKQEGSIALIIFLGIIAAGLAVATIFEGIPHSRTEVAALAEVRQIAGERLERIEVHEKPGGPVVRTISDANALVAFAQACGQAEGYMINHDSYSHSWYLVVHGDSRHEMCLSLEISHPDTAVGELLDMEHDARGRPRGSFQSDWLRRWVEEQLIQPSSDKIP